MDKSKLLIIVVTAVISATVTIMVKTFWEAALPPITQTLIKTAKATFKENVIRLLQAVFLLSLSIYFLVKSVKAQGPVTRVDVLVIAFWFMSVCFWIVALMVDIIKIRVKRYTEKEMVEHFLKK